MGRREGREAGEGGAGEGKKTTEPYLKNLLKKICFLSFLGSKRLTKKNLLKSLLLGSWRNRKKSMLAPNDAGMSHRTGQMRF